MFTMGKRWKWQKSTNSSLKLAIKLCVMYKKIKLNLVKIKGHSNDTFNDIADSQVKRGILAQNFIDLDFLLDCIINNYSDFLFLDNLFINFRWKGMHIDQGFRKFVNHINDIRHEALWSTAKPVQESIHHLHSSVNTMGSTLLHTMNRRCISWKLNSFWSFTIKVINNILPTAD